ncbi:MAG: DNA alkylation repair protein [Anaerolineales bacterium]
MEPKDIASALVNELESLSEYKTIPMRKVRLKFSKILRSKEAQFIFEVAEIILNYGKHQWIAYELIRDHPVAFRSLDRNRLEIIGRGINSWSSADSFSRTLSGPLWREGLVSNEMILDWANSENRWWRRAALVSTVALNVRSRGGKGDIKKTLIICEMLVEDYDDMVVKALSWALRELVVHDPKAVEGFLISHNDVLAARVRREVRNKIKTGLKNP